MRPASSKAKTNQSLNYLEDQLTEYIKKLTLLESDRLEFQRQAQDTKSKNQEWIQKLKQQNHKLKEQRDELISKRRLNTSQSRAYRSVTAGGQVKNEAFWRRQLDKQRFTTKTLKNSLLNLQDKLKDVKVNQLTYIEESPLMRTIRILENRLDKIMIKYNEANAMTSTYEQIVKRLKEERIGYDNQITTIERSLKGKESDFQQLLLLAHDATHAKQLAQAQLKKFEHKRSAIKDLREQYVSEKRTNLQQTKIQRDGQQKSALIGLSRIDHSSRQPDEEQQLNDYEEAFKKLKEATGMSDANEIIQKFKTQGTTTKSLEELRERYKTIIENLRTQKQLLKERLNKTKYEGKFEKVEVRKVVEEQARLAKVESEVERMKGKCEKADKLLVNVKVAFQHLTQHLDFFKKEETDTTDMQIILEQINKKLKKCYEKIKNDPHYNSERFKQSTAGLQKYINKGGDSNAPINTRIDRLIKPQGEDSGNQYDQQIDDTYNQKVKQRNQPIVKVAVNRNFRKFKPMP